MHLIPPEVRLAQRLGLAPTSDPVLRQALTHQSYLNEHGGERHESNERLEFLGDAILGAIVADALHARFPLSLEGELTVIRASLIRRSTLARWARTLDLGNLVMLGRGEERGGGRERDALLSQVFESVVGALYVAQGYRATREALMPLIESDLAEDDPVGRAQDPKSLLQQRSQAVFGATPWYEQVEALGPDHSPIYTFRVHVGSGMSAVGTGMTKRAAQQSAAELALADVGWPTPPTTDPEST